jgi:hypothetical protein
LNIHLQAFQELVPAQDMIVDGPSHGGAKIRATWSKNGTFAFIYLPRGEQFTVDKLMIIAMRVMAVSMIFILATTHPSKPLYRQHRGVAMLNFDIGKGTVIYYSANGKVLA